MVSISQNFIKVAKYCKVAKAKIMLVKILFVVLIFSSILLPVQAHQTNRNNGIEITMHMEPNDAPTTTQTAIFKAYFNDIENKFRGENCECFYEIQSERGVNKFPFKVLSKESYDYSSFGVDFEKAGPYTVVFSGQPKPNITENKQFKPFSIAFNFHVESEEGNTIKDSIWMCYMAYITIILVLFYLGWVGVQIFVSDHNKK